jgi:hypothetical protein
MALPGERAAKADAITTINRIFTINLFMDHPSEFISLLYFRDSISADVTFRKSMTRPGIVSFR